MIVENKPGAAGQIAAGYVAKAAPDGYTLLVSTDNMYSINPALYGKPAQDTLAALAPVSNMVGAPVVIAVGTTGKVPGDGIASLLAYARRQSVPLTYASPGVGTPHQLIAEWLAKSAGIQLVHVPYKGTAAAVTDLVGGQVDLLFGMPASVQPMAASGKLKIVAVTSHETFALLPTTPTVAETVKGVGMSTVDMGLAAPAGTPPAVIRRLNDEVQKVLASREIRQTMYHNGMVPMGGTPAEYRLRMAMARHEREKMIAATGVKAE